MELSDNKRREYIQRILFARLRILNECSFYGLLLMNMKFSLDVNSDTAYTDGSKIYFGPKFLDEISDKELEFILMHELLHVVLHHCKRGKDYNNFLFNVACDIVVNSNILKSKGMDLSSITLKKYGESMHITPRGDEGYNYTAEEVYEMFMSKASSIPNSFDSFDDHDKWSMSDKDKSEWEERMVASVAIMKESGRPQADVPLGVLREYNKLTNPQINWRVILRDFMSKEVNDYSFTPPDRRYEGPFFMPDFNEEEDTLRLNVLFAIDTSGSVTDEAIGAALVEVKSVINEATSIDGYIVCLDAKVYEPIPISEFNIESFDARGGGGTSFKAFFDSIPDLSDKMNKKPDLIIFLTDGYDTFPSEEARDNIPVLWIINNDDVTPPWGMVARIDV